MNINVNKNSKTPIYFQIAQQLKMKILQGEMMDGFSLPSEREMAKMADVHRNTVTRAYNELKADGFIKSIQGVGYMITYKKDGDNDSANAKPKNVNWPNLIKDEYLDVEKTFDDLFSKSYGPKNISFAGGMASPDVYSKKDIVEVISEIILEGRESSYFYSPYQGDPGLRQQFSTFMRNKGALVNASEIQVFSETNQALDFLVTLLLNPGDKVILEEPVSPDIYRPIELAGAKIITVPIDEDGMICENLESVLEKHKPKFIYVNSSYHDPTGVTLSLERRKILLELSYKFRVPIIEDDVASEICLNGPKLPSIKSLDKGNNVIYIYSFSLTFIPGIGIAFLVAPKRVIKSMSYLVSVRLISLDWMYQKLLKLYLSKGIYQKRIFEFNQEYRKKRDLMCSWLDKWKLMGATYRKPQGGVYIWCNLPDNIDIKEFAKSAARVGISFIPGDIFFPGKSKGDNQIRLNYSYPSYAQVDEGMAELSKLFVETVNNAGTENMAVTGTL
jgi:DNA-binding transcriptional MocR family regulator